MVPAPELLEVAQIWWDVERVPNVVWDDTGRTFRLVDPHLSVAGHAGLLLARFGAPVGDAAHVAGVLAEGLAACDFPPNGDGVTPERARLTLRAAGIDEPLAD